MGLIPVGSSFRGITTVEAQEPTLQQILDAYFGPGVVDTVFAQGKVDHFAHAKVDHPVEVFYGKSVATGEGCKVTNEV